MSTFYEFDDADEDDEDEETEKTVVGELARIGAANGLRSFASLRQCMNQQTK